jgi:hypothetical protein
VNPTSEPKGPRQPHLKRTSSGICEMNLTVEQLAARACLSARTIRALLDAKALPSVVKDGVRLVKWEDWEAFVATCPVSEWFTATDGLPVGESRGSPD